jgi:hypothetical protein
MNRDPDLTNLTRPTPLDPGRAGPARSSLTQPDQS